MSQQGKSEWQKIADGIRKKDAGNNALDQTQTSPVDITPEQRRRGYMFGTEDFLAPEDSNIFNQDVSTSLAEGIGGLFSGARNLVTGGYHAIVDPLTEGYEESGATGTLGALLNLPYDLVEGATDARLALKEKAETADSSSERFAYNTLGRIPFLGPAVASIGEQIGSGKPQEMGEGVLNSLVLLQASPSFRAMTAAGKAEAIAAIKNGTSRIPVPRAVSDSLGKVAEHPGLALAGGVEGYVLGGGLGAVAGAIGVPSGYGSLRSFFKKNPNEIAEERAYKEKIVEERNTRSDTIRRERRQQTLSDRVDKADSQRTRKIERDAQAHGVQAEKREYTENVLQRKRQRQAEDARLAREVREADELSRNANTKKLRDTALAERKAAVAKQNELVEARRAEDRANTVSDTGERYARQDRRAEDYRTAQDAAVHERNIKDIAKANTAAELAASKELAAYHIQLAKNLDEGVKYKLRQELEKSVAETQARLTQGMEAQSPVMTTRSRSVEDGTQKTVTQEFREPSQTSAGPVPDASATSGAGASAKPSTPPATSTASAANEPEIYQQLRDQSKRDGVPVTVSLEERQIAPEMARLRELASRRILTPAELNDLNRLRAIRDSAANDISKTYNAAGGPANQVDAINPVTGQTTRLLNTAGPNMRRGR
jgi:hypothetical protein